MEKIRSRWLIALLTAAALLLAACGDDDADDGADADDSADTVDDDTDDADDAADDDDDQSYYEDGDVVTLMVPYSAGGGFDLNSRVLAPHFEEALRDLTGAQVDVIVENVEGAAGQVAVERLYRSDPDGMTLSIMSSGAVLPQAAFFDADFDVAQLTFMAQLVADARAYMARTELGFESFWDVIERSQEEDILLGTAGIAFAVDDVIMEALLADEGVEYNTQFVHFDGTGQAIAALLAGDLEVYRVTITGGNSHVEENSDDLMWLATVGHERHELIPDIPTIAEEDVPQAETISNVAGYTRRMFAGPPGMDDGLTALLREAFEIAIHTDGFAADAEEAGLFVDYIPGDELGQVMAEGYEVFLRYSDEVNAWLEEEG